jgi:hypothetical protein
LANTLSEHTLTILILKASASEILLTAILRDRTHTSSPKGVFLKTTDEPLLVLASIKRIHKSLNPICE